MLAPRVDADDPLDLIRVERETVGRYSGVCIDGAVGRVFGGQALAQALRSASFSVGDRWPINSLHAGFVGAASSADRMEYRTEVIKSGRALDVISFRATQGERTMLYGFASAHIPESALEMSQPMPAVPDPAELRSSARTPPGTNPAVRAPFELRYVPSPAGRPHEDVWVRSRAKIRSDAAIDQTALLAYAVDFLLTRSAHVGLPLSISPVGASLDHAMWFHRPFRVDDWLLVSSTMTTYADSRSLCGCRVFDRSGSLVASASQEALIRALPGAR